MTLNNLGTILNMAKDISSPEQAGRKALLELEKKDPVSARMLCNMIYNGKSPESALREFAQSGKIDRQQLTKIHTTYDMLKKLGLKINISNKVWNDVDNIINSQNLSTSTKIKGF